VNMLGFASERGRRTACCNVTVGARQVMVTHTPHSKAESYGGSHHSEVAETKALKNASLMNRARAYFSAPPKKVVAFLQETAPWQTLHESFMKHVLSHDATTANAEKCMAGNSLEDALPPTGRVASLDHTVDPDAGLRDPVVSPKTAVGELGP
jgi:hypothetical protein